jgi:hypothetical protein
MSDPFSRKTVALLFSVSMAACAPTRQLHSAPEPSGFLGDYSEFEPGPADGAQLVYVADDTRFSDYRAILLDSVTLWSSERMASLPREDQQALADQLYLSLHRALEKDWTMVDSPGPGVLRVRAALTEARGSNVPLDVVATVLPHLNLLGKAAHLGEETASTVGSATGELEITDSLTGRRLVAAVDQRVGARSLRGMTHKWSDVQEAFDYWAEYLRTRLAQLRSGAPPR